jgi:hypothetical protein
MLRSTTIPHSASYWVSLATELPESGICSDGLTFNNVILSQSLVQLECAPEPGPAAGLVVDEMLLA